MGRLQLLYSQPILITNGSRNTVNQAARLQLLYSQPGLITNGSRSTVNQAVLPMIPLVKDFHQIYKSVQTKGRDQFPLPIQQPPTSAMTSSCQNSRPHVFQLWKLWKLYNYNNFIHIRCGKYFFNYSDI